MKRILRIILLAAMGLAVFCAGAEAETFDVNNDNFSDQMTAINNSTATDITINLVGNEAVIHGSMSFNKPGATITLLGNGHTLNLGQGSISVQGDANDDDMETTLILGNPNGSDKLTITGETRTNGVPSYSRNDNPGALYIQENGVCTMNNGVTITGIINQNYFGGGVSVQGGTFNMEGGKITNCHVSGGTICYGGGVAVYANGVFNMRGGSIENCSVTKNDSGYTGTGGGVFVGWRSTFNMEGGIISGCTAYIGGGVMIETSDLTLVGDLDSRFVMSGGIIRGCTAEYGGGIAVEGQCHKIQAIDDELPYTEPLKNRGVYISGGEISNNTATNGGGGFFVMQIKDYNNLSNAIVSIENTTITQNNAKTGAGVYSFSYWTRLLIKNCTISGNHATDVGGGLAIEQENGTHSGNTSNTRVEETKLCNNIADVCGSDVYLYHSCLELPPASIMGMYTGLPTPMYGKSIDGWYNDDENDRYVVDGSRKPFNNTTIILSSSPQEYCLIAAADHFTITFNANGHGNAPAAQNCRCNNPAKDPGKITAPGYVFTGWYTDAACTAKYDFNTPLTGDLTLYAGWNLRQFTVTFSANGHGTAPTPQTYTTGEKVQKPDELTAIDYVFTGWYTDKACENPYDFNTPLTGDLTLYAGWKLKQYTVTFNANGHGTAPAPQTHTTGEKVKKPDELTATDYVFTGWYTDAACTAKYDFNTPLTGDLTLYAGWEQLKYALPKTGDSSSIPLLLGVALLSCIGIALLRKKR